jgi:type IV pilus assembly protein PilQ
VKANKKSFLSILIFSLLFISVSYGQDRFTAIQEKLKVVAVESPGLNEKVELSVSGTSLQEFIRGLAISNNLNISVDPTINVQVSNTFSNVTVQDVLLFLCRKYNLDITFVGSIMSFSLYNAPPAERPKVLPKVLNIVYQRDSNLLSVDFKNDSLYVVAKELTRISGKNVVYAPDLSNVIITGYIQGTPFNNAIEKLAFANNLKVTATSDNFYLIEKKDATESSITQNKIKRGTRTGTDKQESGDFDVTVVDGMISVDASNVPITDIISEVSVQLGVDYFIFSEPKGNTTLKLTRYTYDDFLRYILNGTDYTFKKDSNIYLIGDRNIEGLRVTKVVEFKYRSADKILDFIPPDLKKGVDLKLFPDLNAIILSGSEPRILEIESFIRKIDRVVPVVVIDVLIVDVRDTKTLSTGIKAVLGDKPKATSGTVFPEFDMTLSSTTINNLISGINGFGSANLGKVTPNFYVSLQAFEKQGILKIRSTPKLATINGHEAKLTIGETRYYLETQNNIIGTQNPQTQITQNYKPINADLSVTVNPMVSGDEQITLDIKVKQSSFGERISNNAPFGTINRDFESLIRVKNEEMVLLGGLDENTINDSGSGVPFLSRIPVIKWFFSSRSKTNAKNKLTIFIKPTVLY